VPRRRGSELDASVARLFRVRHRISFKCCSACQLGHAVRSNHCTLACTHTHTHTLTHKHRCMLCQPAGPCRASTAIRTTTACSLATRSYLRCVMYLCRSFVHVPLLLVCNTTVSSRLVTHIGCRYQSSDPGGVVPPLDTAIRALHKLVGNANPDGAQLMTCTGARGCALAVLYAMNKVYVTAAGAPLQVGTCSSLEFTLTAATLQPRLLFL
jgi:hypothetical protein